MLYQHVGDWDNAAFCWAEVALQQPLEPVAHLLLAEALYAQRTPQSLRAARASFAHALELKPDRFLRANVGLSLVRATTFPPPAPAHTATHHDRRPRSARWRSTS